MENTDRKIIVKDKDGKDIEGNILFTFEANGDDFVLYEINNEAFAGKVDENGNLSKIEDDEWALVEKIYNEYMEEKEENE